MRIGLILQIMVLLALGSLQAATIHEAIDQGDSAAVAAMLDKNPALLGDRLPSGRTPLHTAAYGGKLNIVQLLISRGADLNATTPAGSVALHGAAINNHGDVVKLLVDKGANVNVTNQAGYTPLTNAALSGNVQSVRSLLNAGANVEPSTPQAMAPLVCAINRIDPEIVDLLLNAGADPNVNSGEGESPIVTAALQAMWRPDQTQEVHGMLRSLVKHGADVNRPLSNGFTALIHGVRGNDTTVLNILMDGGANPNLAANNGATAFGEAVKSGCLNSVNFLKARKARTDALDNNTGSTPLHAAVMRGELPLVEAVLPVSSNPNAVDNSGMTALDYANRYGHARIAGVLKQAGAKANLKTEKPISSTYFAEKPQQGEAYFWYLGNCGYLIKTRNHCLVFDYWTNETHPTEPSLANGFINPPDIAAEDVTVFVTHEHRDHFDSTIFGWQGKIPRLQYVFGFIPDSLPENMRQGYSGQPYEYVGPGMNKIVDGMKVMAVRSNDAGVGFVINVDGLTIYHAGDLAGWLPDQRLGFTSQIDSIATAVKSVDIALVNVTGCHHQDTLALAEGTVYTIEKLHPKLLIPTHGLGREYYYRQFMDKFKDQFPNLLSFCPLLRGDAVKFTNGKKQPEVKFL